MRTHRRRRLSMAASTVVLASPISRAAAQSTPIPPAGAVPSYAIARVRALPTPELNDAIGPDVLATFLPRTAALPGYAGYVLSEHLTDPTATITLTMLANASAAADEGARDYVSSLDARFVAETPVAEQGPVRAFQVTARPVTDLPPFLHGCQFTMRERRNAPDADIEDVVAKLTDGLVPLLMEMPGFVLYCWIQTEDGRVAINIWETADQVVAGNEAVAAWVAENTANTTTGDPVVSDGSVVYADIPEFI